MTPTELVLTVLMTAWMLVAFNYRRQLLRAELRAGQLEREAEMLRTRYRRYVAAHTRARTP